jgi:hypothetical protein
MIHWFNDVSGWVATEIVSKDTPKTRFEVIKYFLKVAQVRGKKKKMKRNEEFNSIFFFFVLFLLLLLVLPRTEEL